MIRRFLVISAALALTACSSAPPPPDWKMEAHGQLENFTQAWLDGDSRRAEANFQRARAEIARTGRLDLIARAELHRCAVQVAALETGPCTGFEAMSAHADAVDRAYYHFISGRWKGLDAGQLPVQYRGLVAATNDAAREASVQSIADPVSRSIASGALLIKGVASPAIIAGAVQTASERGWRRPLLAWLRIEEKRAEAVGDENALNTLRQRIRWVMSSMPASQ